MLWQDHTWPELADAARKGYLVVQPCGSTEQHGKHLPVDTDSAIVFEVAQRAADEVGRTLVLPCLHYGLSSHHLDFPGTVSLSLETYTALFRDIARCVAHHGFKILILLNGHGGNTAALKAISGEFLHEIDIRIMAATYWDLIDSEAVARIRTSPMGGMSHSGEFETSIQLAMRSDRVKTDRYVTNPRKAWLPHTKKDMFREGCISFPVRFKEAAEVGTLGDPTSATAQKGEAFLKLAVAAFSDILKRLLERQTAKAR